VLALTGYAERWIDPRLGNVFSRVTAIILAALSVQYIVDGLAMLGIVTGAS
jgi:small neutral amino acid transporter SnatA (MarC family)